MTDARDNGNLERCYMPREPFVIEGHEVFEGASAPYEQHHINPSISNGVQRCHEMSRGILPLYGHSSHDDLCQGIATTQGAQNIIDGRSPWRRDQSDALRQARQGQLGFGAGEPFCFQLLR